MVTPDYGYINQMYRRSNSVVSLYYTRSDAGIRRGYNGDGREEIQATILLHASSHEVTLMEMDDCNLFNEPSNE
ncbi:hypothetical protein [Flavisolibacter ginsengisoli]|jgi:hypothetical protein|uniref:Uncharacterized protein n=1 Tax=Flavisolibacter ginsengisoli DSM 18119 TaxID=1121884 RepID=A0A1M5G3J3_9BACT|nr:hypothetical protein [Flavisolibacter ginsengisoli]SHF98286.1 hypothetical protein SAMN02745131_04039 [Flavisolibacter ginsengisoli DSM 18119]